MENKKWDFSDGLLCGVIPTGLLIIIISVVKLPVWMSTVSQLLVTLIFPVIFWVLYGVWAMKAHNKIVEKNIKDKKAEGMGEYNSYKGWE